MRIEQPIYIEGQIQQRRKAILDFLQEKRFVRTVQLSNKFGISEVSIRKDLDFLEERGLVKRIHGGAQLASDALSLLDLTERYLVNRTAKEQIAREAVKLIGKPGQQIYIDTGTTTLLLSRLIPRDFSIIIFTCSLSTIAALEGRPLCKVVTFGGVIDYKDKLCISPWDDFQLSRYHFDILFAGANSVFEDGFGCDDLAQTEQLRKAISRSRISYVLADSSKANKKTYHTYAESNKVEAWITDGKVDTSFVKAFQAKGGKVIIAES